MIAEYGTAQSATGHSTGAIVASHADVVNETK